MPLDGITNKRIAKDLMEELSRMRDSTRVDKQSFMRIITDMNAKVDACVDDLTASFTSLGFTQKQVLLALRNHIAERLALEK